MFYATFKHLCCRASLCSRLMCGQSSRSVKRQLHAEAQTQRGLVEVRGTEAMSFLQGLITNDMEHLRNGATSLYCMMLNTQGRLIFDTIVYKKNIEHFIIESDSEKVDQLIRHLKMFRVRKKIDIESVDKDFQLWCVFDPKINFQEVTQTDMDYLYMNPNAESESEAAVLEEVSESVKNVIVTRDPRMKYLGHRLILPANISIKDCLPNIEEDAEESYKVLRYRLGVGEGVAELPPTKCLPLEANCDYLHGVSFHKGCYIGQELTARTFHTGVVRKRFMPLLLSGDTSKLGFDDKIVNEKGKSVGKVRGILGQFGIGLLRIQECLSATSLSSADVKIETFKPAWWPVEVPKVKLN